MRLLPNSPVDRARTRWVAAWRATQRLSVALEYNPGEDELLPNFNFALSLPGEHLPHVGLIAGTSSDRIGTPSGRAWFVTAPFSLPADFPLPVNGYVGASYGTFAEDLRAIGGLTWWFDDRTSAGVQHDGEQLHWILSHGLGELGPGHAYWSVDLVLVEIADTHTLGGTVSVRF